MTRIGKAEPVVRALVAGLAVTALFAAICALAACDRTAYADSGERGNGMPIDATSYDAPSLLDGAQGCWRVTDRQCGQSWWVIRVNRSLGGAYAQSDCYVVLPISNEGSQASEKASGGGMAMAQFCRYCDHMICGGRSVFGLCEVKNRLYTPEHLAHTNECAHFLYNPIDALRRNPRGHVPRDGRPSPAEHDESQTTIYDFIGGDEA